MGVSKDSAHAYICADLNATCDGCRFLTNAVFEKNMESLHLCVCVCLEKGIKGGLCLVPYVFVCNCHT